MANHLRSAGLSAPEIYAEDTEFGFLLLEDLGDDLFARVLKQDPKMERQLYEAATDVLVALLHAPTLSLPSYDPSLMTELAALSFTKYAQAVQGQHDADAREQFEHRFSDILHQRNLGDQSGDPAGLPCRKPDLAAGPRRRETGRPVGFSDRHAGPSGL